MIDVALTREECIFIRQALIDMYEESHYLDSMSDMVDNILAKLPVDIEEPKP